MSWSTDPSGQVFHPEDIQSLTQEGTIISCESPNMQRVHKRRLHRFSDEEYNDLPLPSSPNSSLSTTSILADHFQTIPDYIISRETLSYLGFTDAAVETIWGRWNNFSNDLGREIDGGPVTFESMFRAHIHGDGVDTSATDDISAWRKVMDMVGINQTMQAAIMTPACKEMRMMETCKYWLLDTVSAKYEALKEIQATSLERAMAGRRKFTRPDEPNSPGGSQHTLAPREGVSAVSSQSTSETIHNVPGMSKLVVSSPKFPISAPDQTVLYKGGYSHRLLRIFDAEGNAAGDKMTEIQSGRGGDFNFSNYAVYMVINFEVAQKYAFWAKKRAPDLAVSILRMEIPNSAIEALDHEQMPRVYWPSQEWKQLVWTCRRQESSLRQLLSKYNKATLVIGTICGKPQTVFSNLASPDDMTLAMVLSTASGEDAIQYVFIDDQGLDFLGLHGTSNCACHPLDRQSMQKLEETISSM